MPMPKDPEKRELARRRMSEARRGKEPWNKGKKGKQVAWNKGKKGVMPVPWNKGLTKETDERLRKCIEKMKRTKKQRGTSPEVRTQLSEYSKKQWQNPEFRKQMEVMWADPDFRESQSKNATKQNKKNWADPEFCEKMSKIRKAMWKDPEFRKRWEESRKQFREDPKRWALWIQRQSKSHQGRVPWNKGKCASEEAKKKMRENHKGFLGRHHREETKVKISESLTGENHFFYGKHPTEATLQKMSESHRGKGHTEETKRKLKAINLGRHHSKEVRERMSKAHKGNPGHWVGKNRSELTKRKISETKKKQWCDLEYIEKMKKALKIRPNKPERLLQAILEELLPNEYKYVGDLTFVLGGKCPDFMNVNGQKKLIEIFGMYWHNPKYFPETETPKERIKYFRQFGFDTLIIWQEELEDKKLLSEKVINFHYGVSNARRKAEISRTGT